MKAWVYSRGATRCGSCRSVVLLGAKMLEVRGGDGTVRLVRCAGCAKRDFYEDPPAVIELDGVVVAQPTLPIEQPRQPDFVTASTLARHNRYADFRRRQSGESE